MKGTYNFGVLAGWRRASPALRFTRVVSFVLSHDRLACNLSLATKRRVTLALRPPDENPATTLASFIGWPGSSTRWRRPAARGRQAERGRDAGPLPTTLRLPDPKRWR